MTMMRVRDVPINDQESVRLIPGPVCGIGLGGFLAGCDVLIAAPIEHAALVEKYLAAMLAGDTDTGAIEIGRPSFGSLTLPEVCIIVRPGEVVQFPTELSGVAVFLARPYLGNVGENNGTAASDPVRPATCPVLRVFETPTDMQTVSWTKVQTQLMEFEPPTSLAGVSTVAGTLARIPPGVSELTLYVYDGTIPLVTQVASLEIYWMNGFGQWMHNDADDLDAAGRGEATAAHSAEAFVIPPGAIAITVLQPVTTETVTAAFFAR